MQWSFEFVLTSIFLGIGLAMDAFSVSLANGLSQPDMKKKKQFYIALVFAAFQAIMPLIGWFCVSTVANKFEMFEKFIPWIALILLLYIGGGMIKDGIKNNPSENNCTGAIGFCALIVQGIATSIDALSVGFTISGYNALMAVACALIIASVTFVICMAGVSIGKRCGTRFSGKSAVLGGAILVFIGLEIFINGVF